MDSRVFQRSMLLLATAAALIASGCRQSGIRPDTAVDPSLPNGYTCCNLHYSGDWINDANYAELPMIPVGTPIRVTGWGRYYAHVDIDGDSYRLGLDYGREQETTEQWVAKLIVSDDPKVKLASYPPMVRRAIQNSQVMLGMTREQVIMALGYPEADQNPRLDVEQWRYSWSGSSEFQVHWSPSWHVSKVTGDPEAIMFMSAPGNAAQAAPATLPQKPAVPKPRNSRKTNKGVKNDAKSKQQ